MIHTVLVPLDGSSFSEHALAPAVGIARRTGAMIRLALVHEPVRVPMLGRSPVLIDPMPPVPAPDPHLDEELRAKRRTYLASIAERVGRDQSVRLEVTLLDGVVPAALVQHARDIEADLVVMTTHGHGGLSRLWMGSVAEDVVRDAGVPILLLRPDEGRKQAPTSATPHEFRRVLVALDGSSVAEGVLEPAIDLCVGGAELTLLRVVEPMTSIAVSSFGTVAAAPPQSWERPTGEVGDYLESIAASVRTRGVTARPRVIVHTHAARAILDCASELQPELIAMATHGRTGLRRLVMGSVADKVLRGADMPVLLHCPPAE